MEQCGLEVLPSGCPSVGAEVSIGQVPDGDVLVVDVDQALDDDRVAEDAIRQVSSLNPVDQDHPVVKSLVASIKHLEKSSREKDRKILALNRLTMTLEMRLQGFQESSAEDIAKGLLPKIKGSVSSSVTEAQKVGMKEVKKDIEVLTNLVMENMGADSGEGGAGIRASVARLSGNVTDLNLASQRIMGAVLAIDQKLSASGILVKEDPLMQVDIPEVLLQIRGDQIVSSSLPSPSPVTTPQPPPASDNARVTLSSGTKRLVSSTPGLTTSSTFSSLTPMTTPNKKSRWDEASSDVDSASVGPGPVRSLAPHFNSSLGDTPASNPALWKTMLAAQDTYPGVESPSVEQIEKRIEKYQANGSFKGPQNE